jgi:hypothetical protein
MSCTLATLKTYSEPVWRRRKRKAATVTATTAKGALWETGLSTTPLERWRRFARLIGESPRLRFGQSSTSACAPSASSRCRTWVTGPGPRRVRRRGVIEGGSTLGSAATASSFGRAAPSHFASVPSWTLTSRGRQWG